MIPRALIRRFGSILRVAAPGLLFPIAALKAAEAVLVPGATITLPGSAGKSDFLQIDAARHRLLGAHEKDDTADFFDLATNQVIARVKLGGVVEIIPDPKTPRYFVSVQDEKKVVILDAANLKETGSIAVEGETDAILLDPERRRLYITHDNGTHVWVADADSGKLLRTLDIPGAPECFAFDAKAGKIFLNIKTANEVTVIDAKSESIVGHWPVAPAVAPHGIALDAAHGRLYAAGDNGVLAVLDAKTGRLVGSVKITEHVDQAAIDAERGLVYCAGANFLSVVQVTADGGVLLGNVPTAETAKNVAVDPKTHAVWITFTDGKNAYAKSWTRP